MTAVLSLIRDVQTSRSMSSASACGEIIRRYSDLRRELVQSIMDQLLSLGTDSELARSARETSTHYVWPLYAPAFGTPGVFLNEYKDSALRGAGYADSVHNHRYDFATLALSGGYTQETYEVELNGDLVVATAAVGSVSTERLEAGQWMLVDSRAFHRIVDISPGTMTLLVKGAACRTHSLSVNVGTGMIRIHTPVETRLGHLRERLALAESAGAAAVRRNAHELR